MIAYGNWSRRRGERMAAEAATAMTTSPAGHSDL
jgi:hypothetical protein